jgi:hypothetical protein
LNAAGIVKFPLLSNVLVSNDPLLLMTFTKKLDGILAPELGADTTLTSVPPAYAHPLTPSTILVPLPLLRYFQNQFHEHD